MKILEQIDSASERLDSITDSEITTLDFQWQGIRFHATAKKAAEGGLVILNATLGQLFYTVEDDTQRTMAIERVYASNRAIDGAYSVGHDGKVQYNSVTQTKTLLKGQELMTALTVIMLESEAHLRALRAHLKPA